MLLEWRNGVRWVGGSKVDRGSISEANTLFGCALVLLETRRQGTRFLRSFQRRGGMILRF